MIVRAREDKGGPKVGVFVVYFPKDRHQKEGEQGTGADRSGVGNLPKKGEIRIDVSA